MNQMWPSSVNTVIENSSDIASELCRREQANINETYKNLTLNRDDVKNFCEAVKKSEAIYCMGWGISSITAEWFYTRFSELGLKSILMRRGSLSLMEQSRGIGKKDLLIVCELPSYVIEVTEAVKKISSTGAFVVAVADSPAAPICNYSKLQFYVSDNSPMFGSSLLGSMFAVHVLTSILAHDMGNAGKTALESQKQNLSDKRIYYPSYELRH